MLTRTRNRTAFTIIELLVVVSIIALLVGILLPAIGRARDTAKLTNSITNLRNLGTAHASYAAGHNDRQLTFWVDSITSYGNSAGAYTTYGQAVGNTHPNVVLGYGPQSYGNPNVVLHQYRIDGTFPGHHWAGTPMSWSLGVGVFRFGHQARAFSTYLSGRYYDRTFWAPKDRITWDIVEPGFDSPNEFAMIPDDNGLTGNELFMSSYCMSPAAMWSPEVLAYKPETGQTYTNPWSLAAGIRVPAMGQALYPAQKSHMLEHAWLQNNHDLTCNPAFNSPTGCEPWYFNAGVDSVPMTLFFDGHAEGLGVREAQLADARHLAQTGYGLWSRDSPLGTMGYFSWVSYDEDANTSFHILTTDGIRGRDSQSN